MKHSPILLRSAPLFAAVALVVLAPGCAERGPFRARPLPGVERRVVLDGNLDEWPSGVAGSADADYLYFQFGIAGEMTCLQANSETLALLIDVDSKRETGRVGVDPPETALMGVDLEIQFSPPREGGDRYGVRVSVIDRHGNMDVIRHSDIDLAFAPTYAAEKFELRLSRHLFDVHGLPQPGLGAPGQVTAALVLLDSRGEVAGASQPFIVDLPPAHDEMWLAGTGIPAREPDAVRVLTYNVRKASPMRERDRFARIIQAMEPDIVLFQEWDDADAGVIEGWFAALVPSRTPWTARAGGGAGVAIASVHPITAFGPDQVQITGQDEPVRFIGGLVNTPIGDLAVASVHLKCCGSPDSPEDVLRQQEATSINEALQGAFGAGVTPLRIIAGDLNLVGSRTPLDVLRAGLDIDGGDLAVADPFVLGDAAMYTWSDPASDYSPGRLDYVLYGEAGAEIVRAFVLDTTRLSDAALARTGLARDDTACSDHLPVVVDLRSPGGR